MGFRFKCGDVIESEAVARAVVLGLHDRGNKVLVRTMTLPQAFKDFRETLSEAEIMRDIQEREIWDGLSREFWEWFMRQPNCDICAEPVLLPVTEARIVRRVFDVDCRKLIVEVQPPDEAGVRRVHQSWVDGAPFSQALPVETYNEIASMLESV